MSKKVFDDIRDTENHGLFRKAKNIIIGKAKNPEEKGVFHNLALIAFFAWVGLGADGLSSACYGPEEAFKALQGHVYLAVIIGLASAITIAIISASYSQIVELFPSGGGGYVVASKLLSPFAGMAAGSALIIDYVLTITISIASGADAIFSFLPAEWQYLKLGFAAFLIVLITVMNLRGVKESILILLPIFLVFVITHAVVIVYAIFSHSSNLASVAVNTGADIKTSFGQLGFFGLSVILLRAYSMGAGTYTGIEAVSNGVSILREPKVKTAKRAMLYMAISLALVVTGLLVAYLLYNVTPEPNKTLNAVLFGKIFGTGTLGYTLLLITLISEAAILFVAAQAGFIDGPRVIANMAVDRWLPSRFTMLSDRLVTQNGILLMGGASLLVLYFSQGSVTLLVVLYSINVFITFVLSQLGMVRHWWKERKTEKKWKRKFALNGIGLVLTFSILVTVITVKFYEGGWITLTITAGFMIIALLIRKHYNNTKNILNRLDSLVLSVMPTVDSSEPAATASTPKYIKNGKTAVVLVNGFNGLGLHTLLNISRIFKGLYKNFVIIQVGIVDSGAFKGVEEIDKLKIKVKEDVNKYVNYIRSTGSFAEGVALTGVDPVSEVSGAAPEILRKYPGAIFFGGQLVFPEEVFMARWLHNYTVFAIQRKFYYMGIPMIMMPVRL
ncbi:MAG: amino acid transporter [Candidatus Firestonebacteria bacterium RIFOXYC2_FULL_39_67]|nr:MAG: amino acid transporter [Candidatus Firestonebacteria bacterium RIFOXYD2_FULL_39_29]OGF53131.1 MAG: amino acid transporter [Candidatus Firestonebacteria bacterium RifOxyC12_full_39_7]OGF55330.1 MAG: amino acid transporter [Candidatus Firestonebacteria bacterium RIFOXYC2_FULL_39_67]